MPTDQRSRSTYRLISSDGHIVEPPDVWVDRVPAKYRDRCPRIERFPDGGVVELDDGVREGDVLDGARSVGDIRHFSVVRRTLSEIFREVVGS